MPREPEAWRQLNLDGDLTLLLGWRPSRDDLEAAQVELSEEVAEELRALARNGSAAVADLTQRELAGMPQIEAGEEYLAVDAEAMPGGPTAATGEAAAISQLQALLARAFQLQTISARQLPGGSFLFYAVVIRTSDSDVGFVKMWNPRRGAKEGRIWTTLSDTLEKLEDPVFIFDVDFDLIVTPRELAVLRQLAFERLFVDVDVIAAAVPDQVTLLQRRAERLPMTAQAASALEAACKERRSLAKRLRRVTEAAHVRTLEPAALRAALTKHELDPARLLDGDTLRFDDAEASTLLDLLEQLYYETDFTGEHRRADRYSALPPGGEGSA